MQTIIVEALGAGWVVDVPGLVNPMIFRRGASAERVARDLAIRLAAVGEEVLVERRLRGGAVAASYLIFPPPANQNDPLWRPAAIASLVTPVEANACLDERKS